jgi:predicted HTH transcriptional regulator
VQRQLSLRKTSGKTSGKIIELIQQKASITIPEMALIIGVTERSVERNIQQLQCDKKLTRVGAAKSGYWEVINSESD